MWSMYQLEHLKPDFTSSARIDLQRQKGTDSEDTTHVNFESLPWFSFFRVAQTYHSHVFHSKISQHWFRSAYFKKDHPTPSNSRFQAIAMAKRHAHASLFRSPISRCSSRHLKCFWAENIYGLLDPKGGSKPSSSKSHQPVDEIRMFYQFHCLKHFNRCRISSINRRMYIIFCSLLLPWFVVKNTNPHFKKKPTWKE